MADLERLTETFLELAHVVPKGTKTFREIEVENRIKDALRRLDMATPRQRNGPTYQAADILRGILDLPPLNIGEKPSSGL